MGLFTRRLKAELDAVKADRERIRGERNQFAEDRDAFKYAAEKAAHQLAAADAANRRLHGRNEELGRRLATLAESDPDHAAALEHRINRLKRVGARILAAYTSERARADLMQAAASADDREAIEAWEQRVKIHEAWRAPSDLEQRPADGGTWRPTHPAIELRRALDRCRALERRLAAAEGRTTFSRVVSAP